MAVAASDVTPVSHKRLNLVKVTFDSSYPTGGEAISAVEVGLTTIENLVPVGATGGYSFEYVKSTGKIKAYWVDTTVDGAAQAEVADTTNLSSVAAWFLAIGV